MKDCSEMKGHNLKTAKQKIIQSSHSAWHGLDFAWRGLRQG